MAACTTRVFISVGSNIDPESNIRRGLAALAARVAVTGVSTFYRTDPIGPPGQPPFVNGVCRAETETDARTLKYGILRPVEAELGRIRGADRYAARPLDLDLLLYGDAVIDQPGLTIPDPDLSRPFVVAGLVELEPTLRLPGARNRLSWNPSPAADASMTPLPDLTRELIESVLP